MLSDVHLSKPTSRIRALATAACALPQLRETFQRSYEPGTTEYVFRKGVFESNQAEVMAHNADPNRAWHMALNKFSDWTSEELKQMMGYSKSANSWGAEWGKEGGYMKIKRGPDEEENCSWDLAPEDGTGCAADDNMPEKVWVCGTCGILYDVSYPVGVESVSAPTPAPPLSPTAPTPPDSDPPPGLGTAPSAADGGEAADAGEKADQVYDGIAAAIPAWAPVAVSCLVLLLCFAAFARCLLRRPHRSSTGATEKADVEDGQVNHGRIIHL